MTDQFNRQRIETVAPTITAGAYSAAYVIGGLMSIDVSSSGGGGTLRRIILVDDDSEAAAMTLYFFDSAPTTIADNAAFAPTAADLKKLIGTVAIGAGDYVTVNTNDYVLKTDVNLDFVNTTGLLYCYAVVTATPTYTATTDLTFRFHLYLD